MSHENDNLEQDELYIVEGQPQPQLRLFVEPLERRQILDQGDISDVIDYYFTQSNLTQQNMQDNRQNANNNSNEGIIETVRVDQEKSKCGYQYPSDTKNHIKNSIKAIKKWIRQNFSEEIQRTPDIIKLLEMKDFNENEIQKLLKSKLLRQTFNVFFGNYQWARQFVENNKSDLRRSFRLNHLRFKKKKIQIRQTI